MLCWLHTVAALDTVLLKSNLQAQLKLYGPNQHGTAQAGFITQL